MSVAKICHGDDAVIMKSNFDRKLSPWTHEFILGETRASSVGIGIECLSLRRNAASTGKVVFMLDKT